MQMVKTESFTLAVNEYGDKQAKRVAILLPGRLDTKDYANFVSHGKYLAKVGFYAVAMDPPGTWESPGEVSLFTTTNYIKAVRELIVYLGRRSTLLVGHSRGGTVAILAGAVDQAVVGMVPIMATYGDPSPPERKVLIRGFQVNDRDMPPGTKATKGKKRFLLPVRYFVDAEQYKVVDELSGCKKPKLLVYGTDDEFTSPEEVESVFEKLSKPKWLVQVGSDHDYRYHPAVIEKVNEAVGKFVDRV